MNFETSFALFFFFECYTFGRCIRKSIDSLTLEFRRSKALSRLDSLMGVNRSGKVTRAGISTRHTQQNSLILSHARYRYISRHFYSRVHHHVCVSHNTRDVDESRTCPFGSFRAFATMQLSRVWYLLVQKKKKSKNFHFFLCLLEKIQFSRKDVHFAFNLKNDDIFLLQNYLAFFYKE